MPDNAFFYYAAYIASGAIYSAYAISLVIRWRAVRRRSGRLQR